MSKNSLPIYRRAFGIALAVAGVVGCVCCLWLAGRVGFSRLYSTYAANTGQLEGADAAIALTPSDPDSHLVRGTLLKGENRLDEAVAEFEQAAALRPLDYVTWLELGIARDQAEDQEGAINALSESVALAPDYAEPRWQLGNVLLRAGRVDEGFDEMRRAARSKSALLPQLIDLAWNIYRADVASVEQAIEPQTVPSRLALARFAARHGKAKDSARIFLAIENVSDEDRRAFIKELLAAKEYRVARDVWSRGREGMESDADSGLTDGGFEGQIRLDEPGFGWQIARNLQAVKLSIDRAEPSHGSSSLRVDWSGDSNPATSVITQIVPVEANARYRLHFASRSEELVTGGLPVVAVMDANARDTTQLAESVALSAKAAPWQEVSVEFMTGKETQAVLVVLRRESCGSNPCPIFGRLWLDDFSLRKL
jgi:tetratricopeptide (TPR) repeat protein